MKTATARPACLDASMLVAVAIDHVADVARANLEDEGYHAELVTAALVDRWAGEAVDVLRSILSAECDDAAEIIARVLRGEAR